MPSEICCQGVQASMKPSEFSPPHAANCRLCDEAVLLRLESALSQGAVLDTQEQLTSRITPQLED